MSFLVMLQSFQQRSDEIVAALTAGGVSVSHPVPFSELNTLYNSARTMYIPSTWYGGGERAVLEARAAGCRVEVEADNEKLKVCGIA